MFDLRGFQVRKCKCLRDHSLRNVHLQLRNIQLFRARFLLCDLMKLQLFEVEKLVFVKTSQERLNTGEKISLPTF